MHSEEGMTVAKQLVHIIRWGTQCDYTFPIHASGFQDFPWPKTGTGATSTTAEQPMVFFSTPESIYSFIYLSIYLSFYLSIFLSMISLISMISINLLIYLSIYLDIYICLSNCCINFHVHGFGSPEYSKCDENPKIEERECTREIPTEISTTQSVR